MSSSPLWPSCAMKHVCGVNSINHHALLALLQTAMPKSIIRRSYTYTDLDLLNPP